MERQYKKSSKQVRTERARRRRQGKQNKVGMICISCIVGLLLIVMATQIMGLYQKSEDYKLQERGLEAQLESEQERQKDIEDYEQFVTTKEYIEQIAKTKLGLVYPNEIIFKEKTSKP